DPARWKSPPCPSRAWIVAAVGSLSRTMKDLPAKTRYRLPFAACKRQPVARTSPVRYRAEVSVSLEARRYEVGSVGGEEGTVRNQNESHSRKRPESKPIEPWLPAGSSGRREGVGNRDVTRPHIATSGDYGHAHDNEKHHDASEHQRASDPGEESGEFPRRTAVGRLRHERAPRHSLQAATDHAPRKDQQSDGVRPRRRHG